jgi:hypothetical protein
VVDINSVSAFEKQLEKNGRATSSFAEYLEENKQLPQQLDGEQGFTVPCPQSTSNSYSPDFTYLGWPKKNNTAKDACAALGLKREITDGQLELATEPIRNPKAKHRAAACVTGQMRSFGWRFCNGNGRAFWTCFEAVMAAYSGQLQVAGRLLRSHEPFFKLPRLG